LVFKARTKLPPAGGNSDEITSTPAVGLNKHLGRLATTLPREQKQCNNRHGCDRD
jgi:hypothetical protein